jgi:hypothetical protein
MVVMVVMVAAQEPPKLQKPPATQPDLRGKGDLREKHDEAGASPHPSHGHSLPSPSMAKAVCSMSPDEKGLEGTTMQRRKYDCNS